MKIIDRIGREKDNHNAIVLYSDKGLFDSLYERSAYAFHTRIKPFKVHVKTLKGLAAPYVTMGVPSDKLNVYLSGMETSRNNGGCLTARLTEPVDENAFQAWKKHIIEQKENEKRDNTEYSLSFVDVAHKNVPEPHDEKNDTVLQCVRDVKGLNLAAMTPMEAMMFLNDLQIKLKNVNLLR